MTTHFILDENVVILAQLGTDDQGDPSLACFDLIRRIIEICHPIVVDDVLWNKYIDQLNRPRNQVPQSGPSMVRVLSEMHLDVVTRLMASDTLLLNLKMKRKSLPEARTTCSSFVWLWKLGRYW